ncbi:MAG: HDOD domain-containing protein [Deltaproteobacteria bacterium]|nr:HDOD domain-containing protein [Deltaproteobacteria bacterium]
MEFSKSVNQVLDFAEKNASTSAEMASQSLAAKIGAVEGLRPFPIVAQKVMSIMGNPNCRTTEVTRVVKEDPGLAAQVMRLANSAFFSRGRNVDSLDRAIIRLGLSNLKEIVCSVALMDMFPDVGGLGKTIRDHMAATGAIAQELVRDLLPSYVSGAFLCGLVHDLGKLLLIESKEMLYSAGDVEELTTPDRAYMTEQSVLGYDHAVLGGQLLWNWHFPDPVPQVVAWHHQPSLAYSDPDVDYMTAILRISDHLEFALRKDSDEYVEFIDLFSNGPDCQFAAVSEEYLIEKWDRLSEVRTESLSLFGG